MKPAIVYLAQNTPKDTQYGRDSRSLLEKSLALFYRNYNDRFKRDILIFHEGDFSSADQVEVAQGRPEIRFREIHFECPGFLRREEIPEIWTDGRGAKFGMGHRHMIRFYALLIFDILDELGYDWCMRLDDDSFIHSPIDYDLFEFMEASGYAYGYRVDVLEAMQCSQGFEEMVLSYLKAEQLNHTLYAESKVSSPRRLVTHLEAVACWLAKRGVGISKYRRDIPLRCYGRWSYYNNFFITKLDFWRSPEVQSFLHFIDRSGGGYKYRWNDLLIQAAAVQLFLKPRQIHKFTDWTYEHATVKNGKLCWGGIYRGSKDTGGAEVAEFKRAYGATRVPLSWSR